MEFSNLKTGDIILSYVSTSWNPSTWVSGLIRKISNQKWSHISIVVSCWDTLFFVEALPGGVKMTPISQHPKNLNVMIRRSKNVFIERELACISMSKIGYTKYDMSSVMWFQLLKQITGKWYGHTNASNLTDKTMYCSELVGWIYKLDDWWKLTPGDFANDNRFETIFEWSPQ